MESNQEDSQLMREAARSAWRRDAREKQIADIVAEHLGRLRLALREDFHITDAETAARVLSALREFEQCGVPECHQDATVIALQDGELVFRCASHGTDVRAAI